MGCCGCSPEEDKSKRPARPLSEEDDRKCTDVLCLMLFTVFMVGMIVVAGVAFSRGNYKLIVNGMDYRGCTCGTQVVYENGTCTESSSGTELPSKSVFGIPLDVNSPSFSATPTILCSTACPTTGANNTGSDEAGVRLLCYYSTGVHYFSGDTFEEQLQAARASSCPSEQVFATYVSTSVAGYCIPQQGATAFKTAVESQLGSESWTNAIDSINKGKWVILGCSIGALVLGFVYLFLLRVMAPVLTWVAIAAVQVLLVVGGVFFFLQANRLQESLGDGYTGDTNWQLNMGGAVTLFVLAVLFFCLIVFLRKRINLALDLIKMAANALYDVSWIVLFPVVIAVVGLGITALWSAVAVSLYSIGEIKAVDNPAYPSGVLRTVELDDTTRYALIYHIFGFFWSTQFLIALTETVVAFVACCWFFTPRNPATKEKEGLPSSPTWAAFKTVVRYHLGSIAFGSAVIAIIKFIRAVIEYVDHRLKKMSRGSNVVRFVMCCCRCCFWCLEKWMRFLNRNAYIMMALTNQGFCASSAAAFSAIASNAARVGALAMVSTPFLLFGRLFISAAATGIGYIVFTQVDTFADPASDDAIPSPFFPCLIIAVVGYVVGALFMSVYGTTIDAMLMSFIFDETHHIMDESTKADLRALNDSCATKLGRSGETLAPDVGAAAGERGDAPDYGAAGSKA